MEYLFVQFDDDYFLAFSNENKSINKNRKNVNFTDDVRVGKSIVLK